ncbi:hypothetical protein HYU92_04530 [Candidatus Curtissbacteria bacterium]|nr:hypothetical protein [Candidatus Curtissbacteria bacterium]
MSNVERNFIQSRGEFFPVKEVSAEGAEPQSLLVALLKTRIADLERAVQVLGEAAKRVQASEAKAREAEQKATSYATRLGDTLVINQNLIRENQSLRRENEAIKQTALNAAKPRERAVDPRDPQGYYRALGVDPDDVGRMPVDEADDYITRLWRTHSMVRHPDHGGDTRRQQVLNEAYEFLKSPLNRRQYGR